MKVIKNNQTYDFDLLKIRNAIIQAQNQVGFPNFKIIDAIVDELNDILLSEYGEVELIPVETIENYVMSLLYRELPDAAREYSSYKIKKEQAEKNPTEIEKVLFVSPEVNLENGNKNANLTHIKNAYLAEIPSKELMRELLPRECLEAHNRGIVYFHDMAYSARSMTNCCLFNLEELFKGCEINGIWIETPKSFRTACTVATQALTHATSQQYGGITINLLHLAKFVDISRQKIRKEVKDELDFVNCAAPLELKEELVEKRLAKEIKDGMQTFLYQNNTLCAGTGQAVFLSVSVWLDENPDYTDDLILVFTEMLKQRIEGMSTEDGGKDNPNFPKILVFLDDKFFKEGGKYRDIARLCAECSAKRLVPDYLSIKKHMDIKKVPTAPMGKCKLQLI